MEDSGGDTLALACVADQSVNAAALHEALVALFPHANVARVDTEAERVLPHAIDCVVVDAVVNGASGLDVLRRLRAAGYAGAAVLIAEPGRGVVADEAGVARLGARSCSLDGDLVTPLAAAVADALSVHDDGRDGAPSNRAVRALRHTQRLVAAGELALRLQHSLNNPLAGLLAEAQLLELEPLDPEHRASVERIIELCRRVIGVVRGLDGIGKP
jgi:signal transduction histidine kinase